MMRYLVTSIFLIGLGLLLVGADLKKHLSITGETMGTTYHVSVVTGYLADAGNLKEKIDQRLQQINRSMSTYLPDSEISRFNAMGAADEKFCPTEDFLSVVKAAGRIYRLTEGAWDGTVGPLVRLWGFNRPRLTPAIPSDEDITRALTAVGFSKIVVSDDGCLVKRHPDIRLDLAAIAKGYGVDAVSKLIQEKGFENYLVEIGGEVIARGLRKDGKPWLVGIADPRKGVPLNTVYKVIPLRDRALATSGDYRNYFQLDGKTYSHVLDPRSGRPVQNRVAAVSIIAPNCTFADGLATAVMVLGHKSGLDLVTQLKDVECLIVVHGEDGHLKNHLSPGFFSQ
jgi:thiamine biosynthesis lipoprotein